MVVPLPGRASRHYERNEQIFAASIDLFCEREAAAMKIQRAMVSLWYCDADTALLVRELATFGCFSLCLLKEAMGTRCHRHEFRKSP